MKSVPAKGVLTSVVEHEVGGHRVTDPALTPRERFPMHDYFAVPPPFSSPYHKPHSTAERFWRHVQKTESCWLWTGAKGHSGYGHFTVENRQVGAHCASWEMHNGKEIPAGMYVCHNCPEGDRKDCVNPNHLWLGTRTENMRDASAKGQLPRGEQKKTHRLTEVDILAIRDAAAAGPVNLCSLARLYGVSEGAIRKVIRGETWRYLLP